MTRLKPWTRSQMISSWRRTRRWLGAKPPGRSLTAKRSFNTQVKLRGTMPAAHLPFTMSNRPLGSRRYPFELARPSDQAGRLDRRRHVVDADHVDALGHGPGAGGERPVGPL